MYVLSVRSIAISRKLNIIVFTKRTYSISDNVLIFLSEIYLAKESYHAQKRSFITSHNMNKYVYRTEVLRTLNI